MIRWKMVEADDNAFVSPFPRLSSLLLVFEDSQTGSPPLSAARGRNLAGSRRVRGGDGTLLSGNLYRIHSPATDTLNPFARRGGVALPRLESLFIAALNSTRSRALLISLDRTC